MSEEDQALYIRDEDDMWRELPTISKDGILMSWTSEMGYLRLGEKLSSFRSIRPFSRITRTRSMLKPILFSISDSLEDLIRG